MKETAGMMLTLRKANDTPTARASMLVATARGSIALGPRQVSVAAGVSFDDLKLPHVADVAIEVDNDKYWDIVEDVLRKYDK